MVEGEDIIVVVVVSQVNTVVRNIERVIDFGATKHICDDRSVFYDYETMAKVEGVIWDLLQSWER